MKEVAIAFINNKTKKSFEVLKEGRSEDKQLHQLINKAFDNLKQNPLSGTKIKKKLWPKEYIKKYKINNLWKYNLPNA